MAEQWKPISQIPGYESFTNYEMNQAGVLRNHKGYIMKWSANEDDQLKLKVWGERKQKTIYQYIALAKLFGIHTERPRPKPRQWFFHFDINQPLV